MSIYNIFIYNFLSRFLVFFHFNMRCIDVIQDVTLGREPKLGEDEVERGRTKNGRGYGWIFALRRPDARGCLAPSSSDSLIRHSRLAVGITNEKKKKKGKKKHEFVPRRIGRSPCEKEQASRAKLSLPKFAALFYTFVAGRTHSYSLFLSCFLRAVSKQNLRRDKARWCVTLKIRERPILEF